jgi:hypothetical protein
MHQASPLGPEGKPPGVGVRSCIATTLNPPLRNTVLQDLTPELELRLTVNGTVLKATLLDSEPARDFASLLPLTLTLTDYAQTEKVSDLPKRLSTEGAPEGADPDVSDVAYYAPWGNLAIFYGDYGYSRGLVKLGRIESGIDELARMSGDFRITIDLVESCAG